MNLGTIINSSLPWYKISPLSGHYPCETKTSQETEKNFTKVFRAVTEAKSYLYGRFIRIWKVVWRIIMESSNNYTLRAQKQAKLQNELYVEQKKGHQPYYCNLDWLKSGGKIPWNGITICRMTRTSWQTGNLKMSEDLVNRSKDQLYHLTHWLDISQNSERERQSTNSSICKEIVTKNLSRICFDRGWIWEEKILTADIEELEKLDASETYPRRLNAKEVLITQRDEEFVSLMADDSAKLSGRNCEFQEPTLRRESTVRRENLSG